MVAPSIISSTISRSDLAAESLSSAELGMIVICPLIQNQELSANP